VTMAAERTGPAVEPQRSVEAMAQGSSFYAAMRLMPKAEREGMFAIYAFCRAVDDIADDGTAEREDRRVQLDAWRADLRSLYADGPPGRADFLVEPVKRWGLELDDFLAIVDGMQMDVDADIVAPTLEVLDLYCDRVASAVGRLSVKTFGMEREPGVKLAHHLGRALQLTNIVRDIDEDAAIGRLYLPQEELLAAGIESREPVEVVDDPRVDQVCRAVAARAHAHFREADALMRARPAGRLRTPRLMGEVYARILARAEAQGWSPPRRRASIGKGQLLWLVLRHGLLG
jgi:presqualene diphosphate synthase